jgi:hypothetical protein
MRNTNTKTLGKSLAKTAVETNLIPDRLIREKLLVPTANTLQTSRPQGTSAREFPSIFR